MTRLGKYCKIVFMGSMNQIDIKNKDTENNDFKLSFEILKNLDDIVSSVTLIKSERSEYCERLDAAFVNYKENKK